MATEDSNVEAEVLKTLEREREDEAFFNNATNSKLFEELIAKGLVNAARIKQMKDTGASVDYARLTEYDESGLASVHRAAQAGYVRSLDKLFRLNAEQLELETQDGARETPLLVAAKYAQPSDDTYRLMVDAGCNVAAINSHNHGVVELASLGLNVPALRFFIELASPRLPVWQRLLALVASDLEDFSEKAGLCLAELTRPPIGSGDASAPAGADVSGSLNPNWELVYRAGGVAILLGVVRGAATGDLAVAQALRCLLNILPATDVRRQMKTLDGIAPIVRQLKSRSVEVVRLAAVVLSALGLATADGEAYADEACALGALPALAAVLRARAEEPEALAAAVDAIGSLTCGSARRQGAFQTTPDAMDAFCSLLAPSAAAAAAHHQPLLLALARAVDCLARGHRANQDSIVRGGGSLSLVVLLCDVKHRPIQLAAVNAVQVLVEGNEAAQRALAQEGAAMPLVQILRKTANQALRESAARALWALAGDGADERRAMAACVGIATLIEFVGSLSETLHLVGCEGLGALASGARSEQAAVADANGIHPVLRLLKSNREPLVLCALRTTTLLCLGVGHVPNRRHQDALVESRAVRLLTALVALSNSERIRAEAAVALAAATLNHPGATRDMWQPSQHVEFSFVLVLKLLYAADDEVRLLAGDALATFAYNSVPNQQAICRDGGVRFQSFLELLRSVDERHRCRAAFQVVVLSRIFPDEEQALASASGIKVVVDLLESSASADTQALAADCVARLAHTRADRNDGIPDAFVAIETVNMLCQLMLSPKEYVRGCAAVALSYLAHNRKAERLLLNRCRLDPYLTKCLLFYAGRSLVPERFMTEWSHYKKIGLPPIPDGRPCLVNSQFVNPYPTAASRRMTAPESIIDITTKVGDGTPQASPRNATTVDASTLMVSSDALGSTRRNSLSPRAAAATATTTS